MNVQSPKAAQDRQAVLRSFSSVYEPFSDATCQTIAICGAQVVWDLFERKFQSSYSPDAAALADAIRPLVAEDLTFADAWSVPVGQMKTALRSTCKTEGKAALIGLALHLIEPGRALDWSGSVAGISGLCCLGQVIPEGQSLHILSDDTGIRIRVDGRTVIDGPVAASHRHPFAVMAPRTAATRFRDVSPDISTAPDSHVAEALDDALGLLAGLPDFERWVLRLTTRFVPLRIKGDIHLSRSFIHRPGLVCASCPSSPTMLAELLVHEATHQYFYMLGGLSPLDDGTDKTGYYSPVKDCKRPIFNILLAYHAFGNILLFHRAVMAKGNAPEPAFSRDRIAQIEGYMPQFETSLAASPALTASGQALWRPLATRCAVPEFSDAVA
ncbi:aKG-HExxH-type peptide beta-hydroxylase [Tropicibacter sp. S64]|uniref:aKG-HExxH-type peptide beta-hydroxylase n=1 Tax=Tropicibacter sp. S64 TaxID=3415122 RepID=UPI003C7C95A9